MNQELQEKISLQKENDKWKKLLQSNLFNVCKTMEPDTGLIDYLLSEQVLNKRAAESCQVGAPSAFLVKRLYQNIYIYNKYEFQVLLI